jgi:hypothetical protein
MKPLHPNDFGRKVLVEDCNKVSIKDFTDNAKQNIKRVLLESEVSCSGLGVKILTSRTYGSGIRYWFECPLCRRRAGVIYQHPLREVVGCRKCLGLKYKKSRFKGMVEII